MTASLSQVKDFFYNVEPSIQLKPVTTKVFIQTMGILLQAYDRRLVLTKDNFIEEIPKRLQIIKYPGQVTKSFLKSVNTEHNWPQVVALWSYLIDTVQLLYNPEPVLYPPDAGKDKLFKYYAFVEYMTERYSLWDKQMDETVADVNFKSKLGEGSCVFFKLSSSFTDTAHYCIFIFKIM